MPRGNDPSAARDLQSQYGVAGNADELIRQHGANMNPALEAASAKQIDQEATDELDVSTIEPSTPGGEVSSAVVRGNAIVFVEERADGALIKGIKPANDKYKAPPGSASAAADAAAAAADAKVAELNAKIEAELAEKRAELQAKAGEELAKFNEQQQKEAAAAAEEEAAAAEEAEAPKTTPARPTPPARK